MATRIADCPAHRDGAGVGEPNECQGHRAELATRRRYARRGERHRVPPRACGRGRDRFRGAHTPGGRGGSALSRRCHSKFEAVDVFHAVQVRPSRESSTASRSSPTSVALATTVPVGSITIIPRSKSASQPRHAGEHRHGSEVVPFGLGVERLCSGCARRPTSRSGACVHRSRTGRVVRQQGGGNAAGSARHVDEPSSRCR